METIKELVDCADDPDFIKKTFRNAANERRRIGTSMVPVFLDEFNTHADSVEREKVKQLMSALFEIHDEIDLEIDEERGMMAFGNTTMRYHWLIRRLTNERFTLDERTELYTSATKCASLGWLVDFTASAYDNYLKGQSGSQQAENSLIREDAVAPLVDRTLAAIRTAAADGSLLFHKDLIYILYRWRGFLANDPTEVRAWTDQLLDNDDALVILARKLTGESWSQGSGFGGLGDTVARRHVVARIEKNMDILELDRFRVALERLQNSGQLDEMSKETVDSFLAAWKRRREGHQD